ncbi:Protein ALP1-like [Lucilia cuprina]|nr:Protein ALP1-like [Lucilia cuprina]
MTNKWHQLSFLRMKEIDHQQFFIYTRMAPEVYKLLLNLVTPYLQKNSLRESVQPECRLAVTLLYLTQGNSFQSLAWSFKLGKETVRSIILETTEVIWSKLSSIYVAEPNIEDFKQIAEDFWNMWDMPNCIGSIDGKHIAIQCPPNSGSQFFCYKKFFSIVLLAACDARYRFTYIDIGAYGSQSDGGEIFQLSRFGKRLLNNNLPIPPQKNLPNTEFKIPHYFVGDAAFPLGRNLMRPFPGELLPCDKELFNKRLSRARRTIENAFGILVSRWRVLLTTLHLFPNNAEKIVLSCVALHNFIMLNDNETSYIPSNYVDWEDSNGDVHAGSWRNEVGCNIPSILPSSNLHQYGGKSSTEIRNILCRFFSKS